MNKILLIGLALLLLLPIGVFANINNNLSVYYSFDIPSQPLVDSRGWSNLQIGSGTGNITGRIGSGRDINLTQFIRTENETKVIAPNLAGYSAGTTRGYTQQVWVYYDSVGGTNDPFGGTNATAGGTINSGYVRASATNTFFDVRRGAGGEVSVANAHVTATWYHYVVVYDAVSNTKVLYKQGVLITNTSSAGTLGTTIANNSWIGYGSPTLNFDGRVDEIAIWNRTLTASEVSYLYNGGAGRSCAEINCSATATYPNATITLYDFYNSTALTSFNVYENNTLISSTTNGTATLPYLTNTSSFYNLFLNSTQNGGYFNLSRPSQNVSGVMNFPMSQSITNFYGVEKVTGNNLTGVNFTTIYVTNTTHYMNVATYQVNTSRSGYYSRSIQYTPTALSSLSQNVSYIGNHTMNVTVRNNLTNALIGTFDLTLTQATYGYSETYRVTNGILLDNTTTLTYSYSLNASGYFTKSGTLTLSGNSSNTTLYLMPTGGLNIAFIRASNGTIITSPNSTIIFQNSTTSTSYTIVNGVGNVTGLTDDTYQVLCQTPTFDNNTYALTYSTTNEPAIFYCVMSQGTTQITFQIQSPDLTPLANVLVSVEQFINGTFQSVASEYTDGTGQAVMNLRQGFTTRITLSLTGYTTQVNTNNLDTNTYTYTLDPVNRFDPSNSAGSSITYSFLPTQFDLNLSVWDFTLNVEPDSGTLLDYFKITIANANGTILNQINATTSSGGQIILPFDTTPYNGSTLRVTYSFKKENSTEFQVLVVYNVADKYITGSLEGARAYILANFTLGERIFLWMFLTVVSALLLSALGIKDLLNVLLTSMIWLGLAYVFALNMVLVGFIFFIFVVVILRYTL